MNWLNDACDTESKDRMRDNLKHYRYLIRFLINKEQSMHKEILDMLWKQDTRALALKDVREFATELLKCRVRLECVNVLLYMRDALARKGLEPALFGADAGNATMCRLDETADELRSVNWCVVGVPIVAGVWGVIGLYPDEDDNTKIVVDFGVRGETVTRDVQFSERVRPIIPDAEFSDVASWYHYRDPEPTLNCEGWEAQAEQLVNELVVLRETIMREPSNTLAV